MKLVKALGCATCLKGISLFRLMSGSKLATPQVVMPLAFGSAICLKDMSLLDVGLATPLMFLALGSATYVKGMSLLDFGPGGRL